VPINSTIVSAARYPVIGHHPQVIHRPMKSSCDEYGSDERGCQESAPPTRSEVRLVRV
jgi:hypothetical protein